MMTSCEQQALFTLPRDRETLCQWDGVIVDGVRLSRQKPVIMAGPCLLESPELGLQVGRFLKEKCAELGLPYVFKSSYDKANRTSVHSARGPGLRQGLQWLTHLRHELDVPIVTDVHSADQALEAGESIDILQIPAFLCKQRELLAAAASTGRVVQVKKGQWVSAEDMVRVASFLAECGNPKTILVERGTCLGYNNLVVDYRNIVEMQKENHPVVFDATHAVQLPGAGDGKTLGLRQMVRSLTRAAVAVGVEGVFMEVHPEPEKALSDAETQLSFAMVSDILTDIALLCRSAN